jgi:hypothetical protein
MSVAQCVQPFPVVAGRLGRPGVLESHDISGVYGINIGRLGVLGGGRER